MAHPWSYEFNKRIGKRFSQLKKLMIKARKGDEKLLKFFKETYGLRIYTEKEIKEINQKLKEGKL